MHVQYLTEILTIQAQFVSASYGLALHKETSCSNAFVFSPLKGFRQNSVFCSQSCAKMQQALKSNLHAKFMHGHRTGAAPVELENQ